MSDAQPSADQQLKPCPFCGGGAAVRGDGLVGFCIVCDNLECYCTMGEGYDKYANDSHTFSNEEEAVTAWNKRVSS